MKISNVVVIAASILLIFMIIPAFGGSAAFKDNVYNPGQLKPIDSKLRVKIGDLRLTSHCPPLAVIRSH